MRLFFILLVFIVAGNFNFVYSQQQDPTISNFIQEINTHTYRSHFDAIKTSPTNNRRVYEGNLQTIDHDACRDYIFSFFNEHLGDTNCYIQNFNIDYCGGLGNVIGYKKGTAPWKGLWIVCAHYDTNNINENNLQKQIYAPGANDNGTGIAALLEIVRVISKIPLEHSVLFAAWDYEEVFTDMMPSGSNYWYSKKIKKKKITNWNEIGKSGTIAKNDILGVINFDMFGNPQIKVNNKPALWVCNGNSNHNEFANRYAQTINLYSSDIIAVNYGKLINSDHYTFASRNIPAVENLESGFKNDFFYHTADDNIENNKNIDFNFAAAVTKGGLAFLLENALVKKPSIVQKSCISINEQPFCYTIKLGSGSYKIDIFDNFGNRISNSLDKGEFIFAPRTEGLYNIVIFNNSGIEQRTTVLKKKEAPLVSSASYFIR